ncbi:MAG: glycoside hydrolase family 65 protein [Chloroflexi bacterium]|nr:glycoside hydrolase family 65 protein [Chloroflexota bacterium]MBV9892778.1 glycoside hydrolase family 65 protein [Chloroflexota bacterium]
MIRHPAFPEEQWKVRELHLDLGVLAQTESLFALANGHLGLRGNLDEGEPAGLPGTYLNSFYELRPLAYVETGYGYPESGQTVINVTNGKLIHLLVDDEPFDVRYGRLERHERILDLRAGTLERQVDWTTPSGRRVHVSSHRLVSFTQRAIAAIRYEVQPVDSATRVVVQSELVANEPLGNTPLTNDPRQGAPLEAVLRSELSVQRDLRVALVHRAARSGLRVAAAMDHFIQAPEDAETTTESSPDTGRVSVTARLEPGQSLCVVKLLAYGWSSQRSRQALIDQVLAALTAARHTGWDGLLAEQREYLDEFWSSADVELEGDDEVQQAVRFGLFHILQAGARGEDRPVPAKGLTGPGYDGHAFWDTESFVLPLLNCTLPAAAASALRWRQATLPAARERARLLGVSGAAFPWRTINGTESSGYWPASTAAVHVNADIAHAVIRYVSMTGDLEFEENTGLELLVETARLWNDLGHFDAHGQFRIDGVTGPDEYSSLADNNIYTNLMAQQNLLGAAAAVDRHPDRARALEVAGDEVQAWRNAAAAMFIPFDERLGVHQQSEGFTDHEEWDFAKTPPDQYPLLLHFPYFQLYRKQVVKQPDLVLAMHLRGDAFSAEQKARNFAYYEQRTVRDSSLSDGTEAVMAAETGHLDLAYDYMVEAALLDIQDLEHNTRDGVHIAALAGAWIALVDGFGGMRPKGDDLCFSPRLPRQLQRLTFKLRYHGCTLEVTVTHANATYALLDGSPVRLSHHGEPFELRMHHPETRTIPPPPRRPRPHQPPGREPFHRQQRD